MFNSPVYIIDVDGKEGIVLSGQPGNHSNKLHFLIIGLEKAKVFQSQVAKGEQVTWINFNDGSDKYDHNPTQLKEYKAKAEKLGIVVLEVKSSDEIIDFVNEKNGLRSEDKISYFHYLGHAAIGDLEPGSPDNESLDIDDFESKALKSGCSVDVVGGCRTAVSGSFSDSWFEESLLEDFQQFLAKNLL